MSEKTAKLADVAKAAGVSQGTASNVFNRPEVVREEVREKVLAAARKIGYGGPDPKGRLLRAGKVNAIGIGAAEPLSYFFDDPFARTVMASIAQECDSRGAGIALISAHTIALEVEQKRLAVLDVEGMPIRRQWFSVSRAERTLTPVMKAFEDFLLARGSTFLPKVEGA